MLSFKCCSGGASLVLVTWWIFPSIHSVTWDDFSIFWAFERLWSYFICTKIVFCYFLDWLSRISVKSDIKIYPRVSAGSGSLSFQVKSLVKKYCIPAFKKYLQKFFFEFTKILLWMWLNADSGIALRYFKYFLRI